MMKFEVVTSKPSAPLTCPFKLSTVLSMSMKDWHSKLDDFLKFNEYQILRGYGAVKKKTADRTAAAEFAKFKPIQDANYKSDFDRAVEQISATGKLPSN